MPCTRLKQKMTCEFSDLEAEVFGATII